MNSFTDSAVIPSDRSFLLSSKSLKSTTESFSTLFASNKACSEVIPNGISSTLEAASRNALASSDS